jgi:hypothetical protein
VQRVPKETGSYRKRDSRDRRVFGCCCRPTPQTCGQDHEQETGVSRKRIDGAKLVALPVSSTQMPAKRSLHAGRVVDHPARLQLTLLHESRPASFSHHAAGCPRCVERCLCVPRAAGVAGDDQ